MQSPLRRALLLASIALAAAAGLIACQEHTHSHVVTINILGNRGVHSFSPGNITVDLGTIVTWINQDSQPHTVTAPSGFDSGPIAPNGGRWTWVAAMAGTFTYSSLIDPAMSGTITVVAQPPQPAQ